MLELTHMFEDPQLFINAALHLIGQIYHSPYMLAVKIFLSAYVLLLFVDIVLLLMVREVGSNVRVGLRGMDIPTISPKKMQKKWDRIMGHLRSKSGAYHKLAVLEADALVDKMLKGMGYAGDNMSERLANVKIEQLEMLDDLKRAHAIRNRIVHDEQLELSVDAIKDVLAVYEDFLRYFEFLD